MATPAAEVLDDLWETVREQVTEAVAAQERERVVRIAVDCYRAHGVAWNPAMGESAVADFAATVRAAVRGGSHV